MDNFQIETAQNINIRQNVAHISTRIGSFLIDRLIIVAYIIIVVYIYSAMDLKPADNWVFSLIFSLPVVFYSLLFELLLNGQSPGKYVNRIRVVKLDGSKPTFGSYLMRWLLRIIDLDLASGSVALLTILLNGKGQRLGDLAGGTTVISEKQHVKLSDNLYTEILEDYKPTFSQVSTLSDRDMQTIKDLFYKAKRRANHMVINKLHEKIVSITGINTDMLPIEFIEVVINDYNYFTQNM